MQETHRTIPLSCPAGTVLFRPGQDCAGFVMLRQGRIRVSLTSPGGREVVLYRVMPGGLCLQTLRCLANDQAYAAEGVAETALEGEILPVAAFHRRLGEDPEFRAEVLRAVAERFGEFERLVEEVALTGVEARLARVLLRLGGEAGRLETTHEALAAEMASARAVVSRALARFEAQGVVRRTRGVIDILDVAALERIVAAEG